MVGERFATPIGTSFDSLSQRDSPEIFRFTLEFGGKSVVRFFLQKKAKLCEHVRMTQKPTNDQSDKFDNSLRQEFGLPPITNEPDSPPVDRELIQKLVSHEPVSDRERDYVMDAVGKFADWREVYDQVVIQQASAQDNRKFDP